MSSPDYTRYIADLEPLPELVPLVRHHHKHWDGLGYPDGLRRTQIPLGTRILAVAYSFGAMTSDRSYRKGMPVAEALARLQAGKGMQWQPRLVNLFTQMAEPRGRWSECGARSAVKNPSSNQVFKLKNQTTRQN